MSDAPIQPESSRGDADGPDKAPASLRDALGIFPGADHFEILGVDDADRTPERIVSALQDQLARLNAHPGSDSAEADQLRMTLHAAAADAIRDVLSARNADTSPIAPAPPSPAIPEPAPRPVMRAAPATAGARLPPRFPCRVRPWRSRPWRT
jgi:hypothetical protein